MEKKTNTKSNSTNIKIKPNKREKALTKTNKQTKQTKQNR
jgi:hypothetical protein